MITSTARVLPRGNRLAIALWAALATFSSGALLVCPVAVSAKVQTRNAEDLLIVDCLLPGQIRKLGGMSTFMSARRPIRTNQADCEIRGGEYVSYDRANYQTALKVWMDQAMAGSAEAQNYVGEIYLKGLGVPPDYPMAALWLQRAADQGFKRAKNNLGYLYEMGLGVTRDTVKALNLYREASGISGDELMFASAVKVQLEAKQSEINTLQQTVSQQQQEAEALKAKVKDLQSQLDSRRSALRSSQSEIEALRGKLAQARKAAGADSSALDAQRKALAQREAELAGLMASIETEKASAARRQEQLGQQAEALKRGEQAGDAAMLAEVKDQTERLNAALRAAEERAETMQAQLLTNQAVLDQEKQKYLAQIDRLQKDAAGRTQEDWELMKLLETQLSQREGEVREQQAQIASLEKQAGAGGALLAATPTLEVIDPPLTVTRGKPAAMLTGAPQRQSVVGKVSVPASVAQITVNGVPVILGDNGLFRASVPVAAGGSNVQITATDKTGAQAVLDFVLMPQAGDTASASSGSVAVETPSGRLPAGLSLGKYHALVIGNNSYQSGGFVALQSAVNDATAVSSTLKERYGFDTTLLLNATRYDILAALNDLREKLGEHDNLLVYYAGHGDLSADAKVGYWVPVDGQAGMPNTWIPNTAISEILDTMTTGHVMVVADSCYSGALTGASKPASQGGAGKAWDDWVKTMIAGRSRTALTSGGVQPVPDTGSGKHSYFARAFLNVLQDNNRLLDGQRLFREITSTLALTALDAPVTQSPEYAPLQFAGHESGEFFFLPRGGTAAGSK